MEAEARSLLLLETLRTHAPEDGRERESLEKIVRFVESSEDPFSGSDRGQTGVRSGSDRGSILRLWRNP